MFPHPAKKIGGFARNSPRNTAENRWVSLLASTSKRASWRLSSLGMFRASILIATQPAGARAMASRAAFTSRPEPPGVPAATWCGQNRSLSGPFAPATANFRIAHRRRPPMHIRGALDRRHHARRCEQVVVPRRELPVEVLPPVPLEHPHRAARQAVVELAADARVVLVVALHRAARLRAQRAQPPFQRASELRPPADAGQTCPSKTTSLQLPSPLATTVPLLPCVSSLSRNPAGYAGRRPQAAKLGGKDGRCQCRLVYVGLYRVLRKCEVAMRVGCEGILTSEQRQQLASGRVILVVRLCVLLSAPLPGSDAGVPAAARMAVAVLLPACGAPQAMRGRRPPSAARFDANNSFLTLTAPGSRTRSMSGINAPERSQLWLLPDGEKKMTYEKDSKLANAGIFVLKKEDHTMGNLLRM
jgi:hypothetical protein